MAREEDPSRNRRGDLGRRLGSYKSTMALDLSLSVMTKEPFAQKYRVVRPGAVLFLASEGAGTIQSRLIYIAMARGAGGTLPFAWRADVPPLTSKDAADTLTRYVDEAAAHFEATYNLPVTLLIVDTWASSAGLEGSADNEVFSCSKGLKALKEVSDRCGIFCLVVDHFGKAAEAGTRGSSAKEGNVDTVLAALAEKELNGNSSNTRLAIRKMRDGISGFEIAFSPEVVDIGVDEDGDTQTAVNLSWGADSVCVNVRKMTRGMLALQRALKATLAVAGEDLANYGVAAKAAPLDEVREEFAASYVSSVASDNADKAWKRGLDDSIDREIVRVRRIHSREMIWLAA